MREFPPPNSLTTLHTWAHLALAVHMNAGLTNDTQVTPTTLEGHSHAELKSLRLLPQLVRTEEASWMREVQRPTIHHLDILQLLLLHYIYFKQLGLLSGQDFRDKTHDQGLNIQ